MTGTPWSVRSTLASTSTGELVAPLAQPAGLHLACRLQQGVGPDGLTGVRVGYATFEVISGRRPGPALQADP